MVRFFLLGLLLACDRSVEARDQGGGGDIVEADTTSPAIEHAAIEGPLSFGEDIPITATITDEGGVLFAYLYYKVQSGGSNDWIESGMLRSGDTYTGYIDGSDHQGSGMWYYLYAVDKTSNEAEWPDEGSENPQHIRLTE